MINESIISTQLSSITFDKYIGCRSTWLPNTMNDELSTQNAIIELMSHFCLNGSLSSLQENDWEKYCHPYSEDYHQSFDIINIVAGILGLITFIVGVFGNLLTLVAIPYAKWKHRHSFHVSFYKTDIWVLHLALCDMLWCLLCLPYCFLIPLFRWKYPQYPGSDTYCRFSIVIGYLTGTLDWLILAFIAVTRAIQIKMPRQWSRFCRNKLYVILLLLLSWVMSFLILLPFFVDPAIGFGYNCLLGKCAIIPTGKPSLDIFLEYPWLKNIAPMSASFGIPFVIIGICYLTFF